MKLIFTALIIGSTLTAVGQQCQEIQINQYYHMSGEVNNAAWVGNLTVFGSGTFRDGNNVYGNTLKFDGNEGHIDVYFPFNTAGYVKNLILSGDVRYRAGISLTGNCTVTKQLGGNVRIDNIVANNGNNNVLLHPSDSINVNDIYYHVGQQITGANPSNNIYFLSCFGTPLSTGIISFTESNGELKWAVAGNKPVTVEYRSLEGNVWTNVYSGTETTYKCERIGLYRIVYNGETSKVLKVVVREAGEGFTGAKRAYFNGTVLIFQPKNK